MTFNTTGAICLRKTSSCFPLMSILDVVLYILMVCSCVTPLFIVTECCATAPFMSLVCVSLTWKFDPSFASSSLAKAGARTICRNSS